MSITTRAAIARAPHVGWEIVDLQLDEPKAHEVRVKLMAAGLCHSDDHITTGDAPIRLPVVGGHEGAGIVESVGPDVQRVKPGDKIVVSYIPACGACKPCSRPTRSSSMNPTAPNSPPFCTEVSMSPGPTSSCMPSSPN